MKYGRLCNRLFNAAHILAFAIEHQQSFVNLSFYEYADYFQGSRGDFLCRYPAQAGVRSAPRFAGPCAYYLSLAFSTLIYQLFPKGLSLKGHRFRTVRPRRDGGDTDTDLASLPIDFSDRSQIVFFQGWNLRANEYLEKHGEAVRRYFLPAETYRREVRDFIAQRREGCELLIGLVIRHGDYRTYLGGRYFYPTEVYLELAHQLSALFAGRKVHFLIFSDEKQDTSAFSAAQIPFYFRAGHMIENLYSLAECDYIVSPPSTYAMWASFYGKTPLCLVEKPGQVIALESFSVCTG